MGQTYERKVVRVKNKAPKADANILAFDRTHTSAQKELDTGMKVGEAMDRAMMWWENKGRPLVKDKNLASDNPGFGSFTPNPQSDEEADNWFPSGIMAGLPWVDLTREEKLRVVAAWHHNQVRVPTMDPADYIDKPKPPGTCHYCEEPSIAYEDLPGQSREMCRVHFEDRYPEEFKQFMNSLDGGDGSNNNPTTQR